MAVKREIDVQATPGEVFEALVTEEGRERWLDEPERDVHVEVIDAPHRLTWWWTGADEPTTRVDFSIVAVPAGARVTVVESVPSFPLATMAASLALVVA